MHVYVYIINRWSCDLWEIIAQKQCKTLEGFFVGRHELRISGWSGFARREVLDQLAKLGEAPSFTVMLKEGASRERKRWNKKRGLVELLDRYHRYLFLRFPLLLLVS